MLIRTKNELVNLDRFDRLAVVNPEHLEGRVQVWAYRLGQSPKGGQYLATFASNKLAQAYMEEIYRRVEQPTTTFVESRIEPFHLLIPVNDYAIPPGNYDREGIARLLRNHTIDPSIIHFIAEMMSDTPL